jgi:hypothetical protein
MNDTGIARQMIPSRFLLRFTSFDRQPQGIVENSLKRVIE